jgi:hypothetical protein
LRSQTGHDDGADALRNALRDLWCRERRGLNIDLHRRRRNRRKVSPVVRHNGDISLLFPLVEKGNQSPLDIEQATDDCVSTNDVVDYGD